MKKKIYQALRIADVKAKLEEILTRAKDKTDLLEVETEIPIDNDGSIGKTGTDKFTYVYKYNPNGTAHHLKAIRDAKGESIGEVSPQVKSTVHGYKYFVVKDKQGQLKAVIFEGVLHHIGQGPDQRFSTIVEEQAQLADLRQEKLKLKLHLTVKADGTVDVESAEVANEAPLLLASGGKFKKGDLVEVSFDEEKKHNRVIKVIGRSAAIMEGRVYDVNEEGIKQDRAEIKLVELNEDGTIKQIHRVSGWETRPIKGAAYGRGRVAISNLPESLKGKYNAIDFATGEVGLIEGDDVTTFKATGKFLNDTAYLPGAHGYYTINKEDPLWNIIRDRNVEHSPSSKDTVRISKRAMNQVMAEYHKNMEELKHSYQQAVATSGGLSQVKAFVGHIQKYVPGITATIVAHDANNTVIGNGEVAGAVSYGIQLEVVEGVNKERMTDLQKQIEFVRENFNGKKLVLNPAFDDSGTAAQSTEGYFQLGTGLGLSLVSGITKPNEGAVFLHELIHEYMKKLVHENKAGAFVQVRVTNDNQSRRSLLSTMEHIYHDSYSVEESIAHYFEVFGLEFEGNKPVLPEYIQKMFDTEKSEGREGLEEFAKFLQNAREALPKDIFKGKMQFMQEAWDKGDKKEAESQAGTIATIFDRIVDFAHHSAFYYAAALPHLQSVDLNTILTSDRKKAIIAFFTKNEKGTIEHNIPLHIAEQGDEAIRKWLISEFEKSQAAFESLARRASIQRLVAQKAPFNKEAWEKADELADGMTEDGQFESNLGVLQSTVGKKVIDNGSLNQTLKMFKSIVAVRNDEVAHTRLDQARTQEKLDAQRYQQLSAAPEKAISQKDRGDWQQRVDQLNLERARVKKDGRSIIVVNPQDPAHAKLIDQIVALDEKTIHAKTSKGDIIKVLHQDSTLNHVIVNSKGEVEGYIISSVNANGDLWIFRYGVSENVQRAGLGKVLMQVAAERAKALRLKNVALGVEKDSPETAKARAAYAKWGFKEYGVTPLTQGGETYIFSMQRVGVDELLQNVTKSSQPNAPPVASTAAPAPVVVPPVVPTAQRSAVFPETSTQAVLSNFGCPSSANSGRSVIKSGGFGRGIYRDRHTASPGGRSGISSNSGGRRHLT